MAIEDGMVLARYLDEFEGPEALRRYEQVRIARTTSIVIKPAENAKRFDTRHFANAGAACRHAVEQSPPSSGQLQACGACGRERARA
jgi:2-polyprenyl-6-methoxyphenol hydroxylase-like FAD-dependent oxidoreductase